jgi:hypothetical protein
MDLMYEKIKELGSKMEELQEIVKELGRQINVVEPITEKAESPLTLNEMEIIPSSIINDDYGDLNLDHKDILVGGNSWQYHSYRYKEMGMTAEVEIRRLTAQLTAAYNRIAALEEQLLSQSQKNAENKVIKSK